MATTKVTSQTHTATGTASTKYSFTFPYLRQTDIIVEVDTVYQSNLTKYTFPTATEIQFTAGNIPTSGQEIKIYRDTNVDIAEATFATGSSLRAQDLNNNTEQILFRLQEGISYQTGGGNVPQQPPGSVPLSGIPPGTPRQILQTNSGGTAAEWTSNVDLPGTLDVTGNTTFDLDVSFGGDLLWDASANELKFNDNIKALFGNDIKIYSDGTKGIIESPSDIHIKTTSYATDIYIESDSSIIFRDQNDPGEVFATFNDDSAGRHVELMYGGNKKFETDSAGCNVIGDLDVSGTINGNWGGGGGTTWPTPRTISMTGDVAWTVSVDGTADVTAAGTIQTDAVENSMVADNAIDTNELVNNAVTVNKIADQELKTLATMQSGTAGVLAGSTALAATLTEINTICDNKGVHTTISSSDDHYPTSKAVVDYVTNQIEPLGGLEVIPDEDSFPTTQPASGIVISIANADGITVNSSNTSTTARTTGSGSDNVTINNFPDTLKGGYSSGGVTNANPFPLPPNTGLLVSSTGSGNIYNYHKLLATENDVKRLSDDINDFNERYRVGSSNPSTSLHDGDLFFNTTDGEMKVYDATASQWEDITSVGAFYINTISSSSGSPGTGGSNSFNGSANRFTLSNAGETAQQHIVSINGVIQKPNSGTSVPSEGFAIDGDDILLSSAPATGSDYFIITIGASVGIGTPGNNTVTTAHIVNDTILNEDINSAAGIVGSKLADDSIAEVKLDIHNAPSGTDKYLKYTSNGMEWATVAQYTTPLTTEGDMLYRDGSGDQRLAKGTAGQVLKMNSGATAPEWSTDLTATDTNTTYSISCVDGDNTDEEKIRLTAGGSGSGTDDVVLEAGTGLSVARSGDKITFTNTIADTNLTTEEVQDIVGGMVSGNTETNIAVTYDDTNGKLDFVSTDTNTPPLTTEEVQDIVGAMFSGNTETRITATYEDSDGTIDLVVDDQSSDNDTTYSISCVDGDNSDEEKIRLTAGGSGSGTDDVVLEAGTGLTIARSGDKITYTNTVTNTSTFVGLTDTPGSMGSAGQHIKVNSAGNALEFTAAPSGGVTSDAQYNTVAGTNAGDSFTGTDAERNTLIGYDAGTDLTSGDYNTAIGAYALKDNTTGEKLVAVGDSTLGYNTTGSDNTAVGQYSLGLNTTGTSNVAVGKGALTANTTAGYGVAVGREALALNTTGTQNTAVGDVALYTNTTGSYNVAFGRLALYTNNDADSNTALGFAALQLNTTADNNTAVGYYALNANTTGHSNVAVGKGALALNTTAQNQVAVGHDALAANTTGIRNTAVGQSALTANTTADWNVAIGAYTLDANTTGAQNTAIGSAALGANTTASYNTAVGYASLTDTTTGQYNTGIGYASLYENTTGEKNVAVGYSALMDNTDGARNTAIGMDALANNTTANNNTVIGFKAGDVNTTGSELTAVGAYASGLQTTGQDNTSVGYSALYSNTTGDYNTAIGYNALLVATTADSNTAVGSSALVANTTGTDNNALGKGALSSNVDGSYNIAVGKNSLASNTSASYNTAVGHGCAYSNTTGSSNTVAGCNALFSNTTGATNIAVGSDALRSNTTASSNLAIGTSALYNNTTGNSNHAIGYQALFANTDGINNIAIGYQTLDSNTSADMNVAVGNYALQANTTADKNVAMGYQAMYSNTTGTENVGLGTFSLDANTTGSYNTAVGEQALTKATTGNYNTAVGRYAGIENTTGDYQTYVGFNAGQNGTTGTQNAYVGSWSGYSGTTAAYNTFVGYYSGSNITTGGPNTCIGNQAGRYITTGSHNVCIGNNSASYVTGFATGNYSIYVGAYARASATDVSNEYVFGYNTTGKGASTAWIGQNPYHYGNTTTWYTTSDRRIKKNIVDNNVGLEKINQIQVRNFEYRKPEEIDPELSEDSAIDKEGIQLGVIAQELEEILPEMVHQETTGCKTVDANDLTWYLVNAVKELSAKVTALEAA